MQSEPPSDDPGRKHPASGVHIRLGGPNFVYLTVCTRSRNPWLANHTAHEGLQRIWKEANAWLISDYILMPDHLHCFCAVRDLSFEIEPWIAYWKRQFRLWHGRTNWRFQPRGFHHRLRDDEHYTEKWHYTRENPVRHGLVTRSEDWPFQGRIHDLHW